MAIVGLGRSFFGAAWWEYLAAAAHNGRGFARLASGEHDGLSGSHNREEYVFSMMVSHKHPPSYGNLPDSSD